MKKILSILMILVLVGGVAFAQVEPEVVGSATLSWGIDFGAGSQTDYKKLPDAKDNHAVATHGFYNAHTFKVRLPFFKRRDFAGGSASKEADVYADINFKATPTTGWADAIAVKAALHFYGAYITVYGKPNFEADKALGWNPINFDPNSDDMDGWFNPGFTGWGTKIGYKKADLMGLDVGLKLGSNGSWHQYGSDDTGPWDANKNEGNKRREKDSKYGFGLDFSMQPVEKYLGVEATVNATLGNVNNKTLEGPGDYGYNAGLKPANVGGEKGEDGMVNFGLALKSEPIADMKVSLGFDGATGLTYKNEKKEKKSTFGWDMGLKVEYKWVEAALYVAGTATEKQGWDYSDKDITKHKDYGMNMAAHLGFVSDEEAKKGTGFVEGLAFHATLNAYDLLGKRYNEDIPEVIRKAGIGALQNAAEIEKNYQTALATWLAANPGQTEDDFIAGSGDPSVLPYQTLKIARGFVRTKYASIPLGLNLGVSYKAKISDSMWVKPYAEFYAETNHYKQHADTYTKDDGTVDMDKVIDKFYLGMAYELGVVFSPIEKVEVSAKWNHGELAKNKYEGAAGRDLGQYMIKNPINHKNHNGTFVLALKLIY